MIVGEKMLRELPYGYRLSRPLVLTVHCSRDHYWVAPETFVLYGAGVTQQEAIEEYAYALVEYYEDLIDDRDVLAPHLTEHLEFLETLISKE